jgi:tetratricopeptide (TPR) repeat protein
LIAVSGKLGDYAAQLGFLDALIDILADPVMSASGRSTLMPVKAADAAVEVPDPALELLRVNALFKVGRSEDAVKRAWAILDSWPDPRSADDAQKLLVQIQGRRINDDERARIALSRAHYWIRLGRHRRGISALSEARAASPKLSAAIDLEIADVQRHHGSRSAGEAILLRLAARKDLGNLRGDVLLHLGLVAADRYQYPRARGLFAQVIAEFPGTPAAAQSAYEAAQVEYDAGDYALATRKMLAIEGDETTPDLARNALWMAGWSAYLSQTSSVAIANPRAASRERSRSGASGSSAVLARTHARTRGALAGRDRRLPRGRIAITFSLLRPLVARALDRAACSGARPSTRTTRSTDFRGGLDRAARRRSPDQHRSGCDPISSQDAARGGRRAPRSRGTLSTDAQSPGYDGRGRSVPLLRA